MENKVRKFTNQAVGVRGESIPGRIVWYPTFFHTRSKNPQILLKQLLNKVHLKQTDRHHLLANQKLFCQHLQLREKQLPPLSLECFVDTLLELATRRLVLPYDPEAS